jgi:hypothetical protein
MTLRFAAPAPVRNGRLKVSRKKCRLRRRYSPGRACGRVTIGFSPPPLGKRDRSRLPPSRAAEILILTEISPLTNSLASSRTHFQTQRRSTIRISLVGTRDEEIVPPPGIFMILWQASDSFESRPISVSSFSTRLSISQSSS